MMLSGDNFWMKMNWTKMKTVLSSSHQNTDIYWIKLKFIKNYKSYKRFLIKYRSAQEANRCKMFDCKTKHSHNILKFWKKNENIWMKLKLSRWSDFLIKL